MNSSIKHKVKKEIAKAATEVLFFYHAISKTWLYQYCEEMLNFYPGNHHPPDWPGLLPSFGLCSHIAEKNVCLLVFPVLSVLAIFLTSSRYQNHCERFEKEVRIEGKTFY